MACLKIMPAMEIEVLLENKKDERSECFAVQTSKACSKAVIYLLAKRLLRCAIPTDLQASCILAKHLLRCATLMLPSSLRDFEKALNSQRSGTEDEQCEGFAV